MATNAATKAGNWSDTTLWSLGHIPTNGEDVNLMSYAVVIDGSGVIPASGNLASIGATTTGYLSYAVTLGNLTINVTGNITNGTSGLGLIQLSGNSANTVTINANTFTVVSSGVTVYVNCTNTNIILNGNVVGGSGTVSIVGESTVEVNGNVTGGPSSNAYGIYKYGGNIIVNGTVTAGAGISSWGVYIAHSGNATIHGDVVGSNGDSGTSGVNYALNSNTGTVTLNGSMISGAKAMAWSGHPPDVWSNTNLTQYIQPIAGGMKYWPTPGSPAYPDWLPGIGGGIW
jgi:hypothetical protein